MRLLSFFVLSLFACSATAAISIHSVVGSSNSVDLTQNTATYEVLAGLSGGSRCPGGVRTTIDTCKDYPSGNRQSCNTRTVCASTELSISFTSDNTNGRVVLYDEASKVLVKAYNSSADYTAGTTYIATATWAEICSHFGIANCSPTQASQLGNKILKLGVDSNGDDIPDDAVTLKIGIHAIVNYSNAPFLSLAGDLGYGIAEYKLVPGDEKAYVVQMEAVGDFVAEGAAKITGVAAFAAPGTCGTPLTTADDYAYLEFDEDGSVLLKDVIDGLQNDIEYVVMFGFQDAAGNIGAFRDIENGTCVQDRHTVTPREVYGLLEEDLNCYITTAAYGSPLHSKVKTFKKFRDEVLKKFTLGQKLIRYYYKVSPPIAEKIRENKFLKIATQALLWPAWAVSSAVLYMGLMPFLFVITMSLLSFVFLRERKSKAKKLIIAFLVLSFAGSFSTTVKAQEDYFSTDSAPNEPPYNGTENEEFLDLEEDVQEAVSQEEEYQPDIPEPTPQPSRPKQVRRKAVKEGENPNKWKPYQRVPEPQRLEELANEGLFKITKKGEYLYDVQPSPQNRAASFRVGTASFLNLQNASGRYFDEIYGEDPKPVLFFDYEWQIFQGFGKLGIKLGSGVTFANGHGLYAYDYNDPDGGQTNQALEKYNFFMFPNSLSLIYRLQIFNRQWLVPYGEVGIDYFGIMEIRDDYEEVKFGGAPHFHFAVGGAFLLDVLSRETMLEVDRQYGINHIWLTAEYRRFEYITGQFDFSDDIFNAGIMVEF